MPYEEKGSPWVRIAIFWVIALGIAVALARLIAFGYD